MRTGNNGRCGLPPTHSSIHTEPGFRSDVEGLRAVAVVLVVAFHTDPKFAPGGFVGVDVFFVISGYLITAILVQELGRTGHIDLPRFYLRRARRLLPASILTAVVALCLGALLLSAAEMRTLSATVVATALYVTNLWLIRHSVDYFGLGAEDNPLLHTWSLAVEEQFYLVWPLLLLLVYRRFSTKRSIACSIAILSLGSFVSCVWLTAQNMPVAFFSSPTRAWEFGLGGLASLIPAGGFTRSRLWLGGIGSAGVIGSAVLLDGESRFPGFSAAVPVLGTAAILVAGAGSPSFGVGRILSNPILQRVGRVSYSWYLWHWPVLVFAAIKFPGLGPIQRLMFALFALVLAFATHHIVENPVRFSVILAARNALSFALAVLLTGIGISAGLVGRATADRQLQSGDQREIAEAASYASPSWHKDCLVPFLTAEARECRFNHSAATNKTMVLFGDSHAQQWFPALERIAKQEKWTLITILKAACPVAEVPAFNMRLKRVSYECEQWRSEAIAKILKIRPEVVVMSNHTFGHVQREGDSTPGDGITLDLDDWKDGLATTLLTFEEAKIRTILIQDTPRPGFHVPNCLARPNRGDEDASHCDVPIEQAVDSQVLEAESELVSAFRYVTTADLTRYFCQVSCPAIVDDVLVYRDADHISGKFAERLTGPIAELLQKASGGHSSGPLKGR
jgi:peptidoglycan/LPS O-acetylase OafA/YrhL